MCRSKGGGAAVEQRGWRVVDLRSGLCKAVIESSGRLQSDGGGGLLVVDG